MTRIFLTYLFLCFLFDAYAQTTAPDLSDYNIKWTSQSANSSESMPCGGGDIGLNVWAEDGDLFFYIARSGTFDENNTMPKLGRVRLSFSPDVLNGQVFQQELKLKDGYVEVRGQNGNVSAIIKLWVEIHRPVIHVEVESNQPINLLAAYENWRNEDRPMRRNEAFGNSYKWSFPEGLLTKRDSISFYNNGVLFFHRNQGETVFDVAVRQQGMEAVKEELFNPLKNLTFGGFMSGDNMIPTGTDTATYLTTPYKSWHLTSKKPARKHHIQIALHTDNTHSGEKWLNDLTQLVQSRINLSKTKRETRDWWKRFWERSYIIIQPDSPDSADVNWQVGRNYNLFRYMLACNAYGSYPTKFNGGLFTYDPQFSNPARPFTPDFRNWGGGTFTAQNQRLVYFPMFRSGDLDMLRPQLDFYKNLLGNATKRTEVYWGHTGACFTEQIENFGLPNPTEYGWNRPDYFDKGIEYNAWLEYQWDTVLEICWMALELHRYNGADISEYLPLIKSCLVFFDEHYSHLARNRGRRELDGNGQLVLYPGTACETYKMATNATTTIIALKKVTEGLLDLPDSNLSEEERTYFESFLLRIPPYRYREINGRTLIAPAWSWERINNTEVPQLYPVYPWGMYGMGKPGLDIARNTYLYDEDVLKFRGHESWKQDNIFAARLGLTDEALHYTTLKLKDSGRRFPAFWGPGFDWVPDHNWGGSGMIGLQEMLLQCDGDRILLFPAWPKDLDVQFRLHVYNNTIVEAELKDGKIIKLEVSPPERRDDVEIYLPTE